MLAHALQYHAATLAENTSSLIWRRQSLILLTRGSGRMLCYNFAWRASKPHAQPDNPSMKSACARSTALPLLP